MLKNMLRGEVVALLVTLGNWLLPGTRWHFPALKTSDRFDGEDNITIIIITHLYEKSYNHITLAWQVQH